VDRFLVVREGLYTHRHTFVAELFTWFLAIRSDLDMLSAQ